MSQFDYIVFSKNIWILNGKVLRPGPYYNDLGCSIIESQYNFEMEEDKQLVSDNRNGKKCYGVVQKDYYQALQVSNHFPLFAEFGFLY